MTQDHANSSTDGTGGIPLFLLDNLSLWDLDTDEAREVVETRQHAHHEAGHAWAAHKVGLPLQAAAISHDNDPYLGKDDQQTARVAAIGFLTQGLAIEADIAQADGEALDPEWFDTGHIWEHTWSVRQETCCCRRGGDQIAEDLLDDKDWVEAHIPALIRDWDRIDALAHRLMTGDVVDPDQIRSLLAHR